MSSAYLASSRAHAHQPDLVRIAALSVAMAINLGVFVVAMRPLEPLVTHRLATPALGIRFIEAPRPAPLPPPPPPLAVRPLAHATPAPVLPLATAPRIIEEGRAAAPPISVPTLAPPAHGTAPISVPTAPIEASLAYRSAPLAFPPQAIRQHMHGTVVLRVLVDETGKPVEVTVEQSSGYALLDRSARAQVLAGWRFQPASVGSHAVRAWARVPVSFELRTL
jgi:periplasmic protein TonB